MPPLATPLLHGVVVAKLRPAALVCTQKTSEDHNSMRRRCTGITLDSSHSCHLHAPDHASEIEEILLNHTMNENQIEWFKAGSALNLIASQNK